MRMVLRSNTDLKCIVEVAKDVFFILSEQDMAIINKKLHWRSAMNGLKLWLLHKILHLISLIRAHNVAHVCLQR